MLLLLLLLLLLILLLLFLFYYHYYSYQSFNYMVCDGVVLLFLMMVRMPVEDKKKDILEKEESVGRLVRVYRPKEK